MYVKLEKSSKTPFNYFNVAIKRSTLQAPLVYINESSKAMLKPTQIKPRIVNTNLKTNYLSCSTNCDCLFSI